MLASTTGVWYMAAFRRLAIAFTALVLFASGPAAAERLKAVTTFTVIADMARNVAGVKSVKNDMRLK